MTDRLETTIDMRPENTRDIGAIRLVTEAAFAEVERSNQTEAEIVDALRNAGALTVSLVALEADAVIGHIAFSPVTIAGRNEGWFGLGPVSVLPARQGRGIGDRLVRAGLSRLTDIGAKGCVVLGHPGFYKRFGFVHDADLVFEGVPPDYFMRLAFSGIVPAGQVSYHDGFNAG